jgi:hypothetical protein
LSITLDLSRVSAPAVPAPVNLSGLTRGGLRQALIEADICPPEKAKMRASQIWGWIHHFGVTDFAAMTNVARDTQARLAAAFTLNRPEIVERQVSADGTRKWLIRTAPGIEIETVYIPDVGRAGALCDSQAWYPCSRVSEAEQRSVAAVGSFSYSSARYSASQREADMRSSLSSKSGIVSELGPTPKRTVVRRAFADPHTVGFCCCFVVEPLFFHAVSRCRPFAQLVAPFFTSAVPRRAWRETEPTDSGLRVSFKSLQWFWRSGFAPCTP